MNMAEMMVTGMKAEQSIKVGRFPCGVCGGEVGVNSFLCTKYEELPAGGTQLIFL